MCPNAYWMFQLVYNITTITAIIKGCPIAFYFISAHTVGAVSKLGRRAFKLNTHLIAAGSELTLNHTLAELANLKRFK